MATFLDSYPGRQSRFSATIRFADCSPEELLDIFVPIADEYRIGVTQEELAAFSLEDLPEAEDRQIRRRPGFH